MLLTTYRGHDNVWIFRRNWISPYVCYNKPIVLHCCTVLLSFTVSACEYISHTLKHADIRLLKFNFICNLPKAKNFVTPRQFSSECQSINIVISKERKLIHFSERNGGIAIPRHWPKWPDRFPLSRTNTDNIKSRIFDLVANQVPAIISSHFRYFCYLRSRASILYRFPVLSVKLYRFPLSTTYLPSPVLRPINSFVLKQDWQLAPLCKLYQIKNRK